MSILEWLGLKPRPEAEEKDADTLRKIAGALERLEPDRARYVASFAYVLSRVANADLHISDEESREMVKLVMQYGELPEAQAALAVEIAKTQNRLFGATDNYLATRELKAMTTREQKQAVLHCLFAVSAADDSISNLEEQEIRQIAAELGLTHEELVTIRLAYRDKRELLRGLP